MPKNSQVHDIGRESEFERCVEELDKQVHAETFGSIDNPDVQREVLMTRKEEISAQCRAKYPKQVITVREPFRFNIIDTSFRN